MYFNSSAYSEVSQKNIFLFTQTKTTLWINHGLYMHNSTTDVNSGYYSKSSEDYANMYHYKIEGGYVNYDNASIKLLENSFSAKGDTNDFFINLHKIHTLGDKYAAKFTNTENNTWESENANVLSDFLAFTASCYTNPISDWDNNAQTPDETYLTFDKAVIRYLSNGDYEYALYVKEKDATKINNSNLKFAVAIIFNVGTTSINAIKGLIN
jgi:hypothetical protein